MAKKKIKDEDLQFIYDTQPNGNLNVKSEFVTQLGSVYSACIHFISLPDEFTDFWVTELNSFENTMLVLDHYIDESKDYTKMAKDSIKELTVQYNKTFDETEKDDIETDLAILRGLSQDMKRKGVKIRDIHFRLYVYGSNIEQLEKRTNQIIHQLTNSGYKATVFLDENDDEYRSIFLPGDMQRYLRNSRDALPMPTPILGLGYGHNQTSLSDPNGSYYGYTRTGGLVYWDLFNLSKGRFYYNFFLSGDMGSGKSTSLKKIIQDRLIRGDLVRVFDKSGEFRELVKYYGGRNISLDGSNGIINMYQVYPIVTQKDSDEVDVLGSYRAKLADLTTGYLLIVGTTAENSEYDARVYTDLCDQYYKGHGYFDRADGRSITDLNNDEYPTISQILDFIEEKKQTVLDSDTLKSYNRISVNMKPLRTQYGPLFDGPTTFENLNDIDFVAYDMSSIDKVAPFVQDLQLYNAITAVYNDSMRLGRQEKLAYDTREKTLEEVRHFVITVDECHNLLNINKGFVVDSFVTLMSEARKFFGGIGLATQRIDRMFPNATNASDKETILAVNNLMQIYGLCQYKFILKHDATTIGDAMNPGTLRRVYSSFLTEGDYQSIPQFDKGDGILVTGAGNLQMHFQMTKRELALFRGGA